MLKDVKWEELVGFGQSLPLFWPILLLLEKEIVEQG